MKISKRYQFIKDKNTKTLFAKKIRPTEKNCKSLRTNTRTKLDSSYRLNDLLLSNKGKLPEKIAHLTERRLAQRIRGGIEGISEKDRRDLPYIFTNKIII